MAHLPEQAFTPSTFMVAHLRLSQLTTGRFKQTLETILPKQMFETLSKEDPKKPNALQQSEGLEGSMASLKSATATAFLMFSHAADGTMNNATTAWMVPAAGMAGSPERTAQEEHLKKFSAAQSMQLFPLGSHWYAVSKTAPAKSDGMDMLDDATFHQGLDHLASFDFAAVVVPTQKMLDSLLAEARKSAKDAVMDRVTKMLPTVAWYGLGVRMGTQPRVLLTLAMTSTEAVASLESVLQKGMAASKEELAKDIEKYNQDADEHNLKPQSKTKIEKLDPAGVDRLFAALARDSKDAQWALDLPTQDLKGLADGLYIFGTLLASAIADAIVPDLVDSEKTKAKQPKP
ncbi:MAG: hypothetical protein KIS92_20520 [Planctomycetota bacterium]|nr:hypothetical protein [Planctomycetota bacterium]